MLCKELPTIDKTCSLGLSVFAQCTFIFSNPCSSLPYCFMFYLPSLTKHQKASCSVPSVVPAYSLHSLQSHRSQARFIELGHCSQLDTTHCTSLPSQQHKKEGGNKKANESFLHLFSATFVNHRSIQARSAHRDVLIEMLFGSKFCPCKMFTK